MKQTPKLVGSIAMSPKLLKMTKMPRTLLKILQITPEFLINRSFWTCFYIFCPVRFGIRGKIAKILKGWEAFCLSWKVRVALQRTAKVAGLLQLTWKYFTIDSYPIRLLKTLLFNDTFSLKLMHITSSIQFSLCCSWGFLPPSQFIGWFLRTQLANSNVITWYFLALWTNLRSI